MGKMGPSAVLPINREFRRLCASLLKTQPQILKMCPWWLSQYAACEMLATAVCSKMFINDDVVGCIWQQELS